METADDGPKNSITIIENFIDKRKAKLPNCMSMNQTPDLPFEFPPGHRIRIQKFIAYIKNGCGVAKTVKALKIHTKKGNVMLKLMITRVIVTTFYRLKMR